MDSKNFMAEAQVVRILFVSQILDITQALSIFIRHDKYKVGK